MDIYWSKQQEYGTQEICHSEMIIMEYLQISFHLLMFAQGHNLA